MASTLAHPHDLVELVVVCKLGTPSPDEMVCENDVDIVLTAGTAMVRVSI